MQLLTLTTLGLMALAPAPAPVTLPKSVRPTGLQPTQVQASFKDDAFLININQVRFVTEQRVVERVGPGGNPVRETVTVTVPVHVTMQQKVELAKSTIYRADGKAVERGELAKLFDKPRMIFLSADNKKLDPFYLQFLADDAIIVVPPMTSVTPGGPFPAPMDAPLPLPPEKRP